MKLNDHEEWRELFAVISWHLHPDDMNPLDTLNRLLEKAFGARCDASMATHMVREKGISTERLVKVRKYAHDGDTPLHLGGPLVLATLGGVTHLIDGQNRLNRAIKLGRPRVHRCLLIEHRPPGTGADTCAP